MSEQLPEFPVPDMTAAAPGGPWRLLGGALDGSQVVVLSAGPVSGSKIMRWLQVDPLLFAGQPHQAAAPGTRVMVMIFEPTPDEPTRSYGMSILDHFDDSEIEPMLPYLTDVIAAIVHAKHRSMIEERTGVQMISRVDHPDGTVEAVEVADATQGDLDRHLRKHYPS